MLYLCRALAKSLNCGCFPSKMISVPSQGLSSESTYVTCKILSLEMSFKCSLVL